MILSERDKKLLIFLSVIILAVAAYFLLYAPMLDKQQALESEISALSGSYQVLLEKEANMEKYQAELKTVKYRNQQIEAVLPPELRQEYILRTMMELQDKADIAFGNLAFSKTTPVSAVQTIPEDAAKSPQGLYGIMQTVKTTYETSYHQLKKFMDVISNYENRICISHIDFVGDDAGNVSGSIEFAFYGLRDETRKLPEWTWPVDAGNKESFTAYPGYIAAKQAAGGVSGSGNTDLSGGNGTSQPKVSYDFILNANPLTADVPSLILGYVKDKTGVAVVYDDSKGQKNAEIKIYQNDGVYYYTLKTDSMEFPSKERQQTAVLKVVDGVINFHIIGTARIDRDDMSEVHLSIENSTDVPLKIKIDEGDRSNPRVKLVKQEGKVTVE